MLDRFARAKVLQLEHLPDLDLAILLMWIGASAQAGDDDSRRAAARRHPQDADGQGAGLEADLFRDPPAAARATSRTWRTKEPSTGGGSGRGRGPRDARPGGGRISAHPLRRTRQVRAEGERTRPGPDQSRAEDQA